MTEPHNQSSAGSESAGQPFFSRRLNSAAAFYDERNYERVVMRFTGGFAE